MADAPILVLGATGGQGSAVTEALLSRGARVRALARGPKRESARRLANEGVEVVTGSLDDCTSLATAMAGAWATFALTTPFEAGVDAEVTQGGRSWQPPAMPECRIWCSVRWPAPVRKAVCRTSTARCASKPSWRLVMSPARSWGRRTSSTTPSGGADRIRSGALDLPLPADRLLQQLARTDLGVFAAQVLLDPAPYVGRCIELASDVPTPTQDGDGAERGPGTGSTP
ncbi:NmrA family NAD(P)-binding protein [Micromonospora sp. DR5-3]|nr:MULTISPECIES: NmrA family NAD(P)-binding protein [unclassified Micromonospora]MCW3819897.1 NmrA family NAD(P)-binding protein [Micromonospora sp. DR5-3]